MITEDQAEELVVEPKPAEGLVVEPKPAEEPKLVGEETDDESTDDDEED